MTFELGFLAFAALLAGFVDAVAGGGGLIQVPALFAILPGETPATLFGTNKLSSIFGTANAAWRYAGKMAIPWHIVIPAAMSALVFSYFGAVTVAWLPKEMLHPLVLVLLVMVALYTLLRPDFGLNATATAISRRTGWWAVLTGAGLGFYDGFFGPGTGSFLIFLFARIFGLDFLRASASAKIINVVTNAGALFFFLPHNQVLWLSAVVMAIFNVLGSAVGSHLALKRGSVFVRGIFLIVTTALIFRFGWDIWLN